MTIDGGEVKLIREDGLNADFFYNVSHGPQEPLVLLGGSEGGKSWSDHTSFIWQLIELGYAVLSLAYFGADGLPKGLRAIPLEYFETAFHWLSSQPEVIPGTYTLMGVSRGAELALLLGSRYSDVKAVVAIAPSSVVFPGPPTGMVDALRGQHSAWSFRGREVEFVPIPYTWTTLKGMINGRRTRMFEEAIRKNSAMVEASAIPVEKIQGPIQLLSFTQDQIWPSTLMANQLVDRLKQNRFTFYFEHHAYDTTHSNWSVEPCRTNVLAFLRNCREGLRGARAARL